jgi:hypothetical protein
MPKKSSLKEFIKKSKKIFGNKFFYKKTTYEAGNILTCITCKKHGDFFVKPSVHLSYKQGCKYCSGSRLNFQVFLERAKKIHKNKYIYKFVVLKTVKDKIKIKCKKHGFFWQTPDKHLNSKQGCPKCVGKNLTTKEFIKRSKEIFGNKFTYSLTIFHGMFKNSKFICKKHGVFEQTPTNHLRHTFACTKCYLENSRMTKKEFLKRAFEVHGNRYTYNKFNYYNFYTKGIITCSKHGDFPQTPGSHLSGSNCPKCTGCVSKIQEEWLDYVNVPTKYRNKTIFKDGLFFKVDAFNHKTNTIYEFYGDYWHGNPKIYNSNYINKHSKKKFKELFNNTIKRENKLKKLGYKIISIWENDFVRLKKNNKKNNKRKRTNQ